MTIRILTLLIFLSIAYCGFLNEANCSDDLSSILKNENLVIKVEGLLSYLQANDPKLSKLESQQVFEAVDAEIEKEIKKHLGTNNDNAIAGLFSKVSDDFDDGKDHLSEIRKAQQTQTSLYKTYELKEKLSKYKPYPHFDRVVYDFKELEPQKFKMLSSDFMRIFEKYQGSLSKSVWQELIDGMKGIKSDREILSSFYSLVFSHEKRIDPEILAAIKKSYPLLNYEIQGQPAKCILGALIYMHNYESKPALIEKLGISESEICAYKDVLEVKPIMSESFVVSEAIIKDTKLQAADLLLVPGNLKQKIELITHMYNHYRTAVLSSSSEWDTVMKKLNTAIDKRILIALEKNKIDSAMLMLMQKSRIPGNEESIKTTVRKLILNPDTRKAALRNFPVSNKSFMYDLFHQDIIKALRQDISLSNDVINLLLLTEGQIPKNISSLVDTRAVLDAIFTGVKNEPKSLLGNLKLVLKLSNNGDLKNNLQNFFDIVQKKEADYVAFWTNTVKANNAIAANPLMMLERDRKISDFLSGYELKNMLKDESTGELISIAVIKSFNKYPSDTSPYAMIEFIQNNKLLSLKHRSLIEESYMQILLHHVYVDQNIGVINTGHPMLPPKNLEELIKVSDPERLVSNLLKVRSGLKNQEKVTSSELRKTLINQIESTVRKTISDPGGSTKSCAKLLLPLYKN